MGDTRNKIMVAGIITFILSACMVVEGGIQASAMCADVDFKDTCEETLANANISEPKALVLSAFNATVINLKAAIQKLDLYKQSADDKQTKGALVVCEKVLKTSFVEMSKWAQKMDKVDLNQVADYMDDVKVILSAGVTCKDTCLDAFQNITGDTGKKVKDLLKTSAQLLSYDLAMLDTLDSGKDLGKRLLQQQNTLDRMRSLLGSPAGALKPTVTVALDGSGTYKTIAEAVAAAPKNTNTLYVIFIKAGVYKEIINVPSETNNLVFVGEGPTNTVISGDQSFTMGIPAYGTATLSIDGDDFMAKDIGIENTAGAAGRQAVALRVSGDKCVFYNVHISSYQSTLYAHIYRQFYRDCRISGTMDIIWGDAVAVFQNCEIAVRKPLPDQICSVTAQARNDSRGAGVTVVQNCTITAEKEFSEAKPPAEAYLGRPMKEYSRTIVMQSKIEGFIAPEGWTPWLGRYGLDTLYYGEYNNRGPGADLSKRVQWKGIQKITPELAESFTPAKVYARDDWIKNTAIPYVGGIINIPK